MRKALNILMENGSTFRRIPKDVHLRKANNNLDIITYVDKYYLAFRTAPSHFASKKTRIYVLSSMILIIGN